MNKKIDRVLSLIDLKFKILGIQGFNPIISRSERWLTWVTNFSPGTCKSCAELNGKVFEKSNCSYKKPPLHERCKCLLDIMTAILAGTATINGKDGADYWICQYNILPANYISKKNAIEKGWNPLLGNLRKLIPGATIGGNIFYNDKHKLPNKNGRIWYEADINYTGDFRNDQRLLYSNDGLVFVTYNHYDTFYEVIWR